MLRRFLNRANPIIGWDFSRGMPRDSSFTRSSTATYFDAAGVLRTAAIHAPRCFDYNPSTSAWNGLLLESQRTNVCIRSTALTSGNWDTANGVVVPAAMDATGIDATTSACTITETVLSGQHYTFNNGNFSFADATAYTESWFVKPGTATRCQLTFNSAAFGTSQYANFSLTGAGSVLASSGGTATIEQSANGFYRITWTATSTAAASGSSSVIAFIDADAATRLPTYVVVSGLTLTICAPQTEAGGFASSYIPTVASSVTRSPDFLLKYLSDRPRREISSYFEFIINAPTLRVMSAYLLLHCATGANARYQVRACDVPSNFSPMATVGTGTAIVNLTSSTALTHKQLVKLANGNSSGSRALYQNGVSVATGTQGVLVTPQAAMVSVGCDQNGGQNLDGWLRKAALVARRYTNAEMIAMTT